jgi:TRAP-type C4-dicarboxylate transport system permease small subunit
MPRLFMKWIVRMSAIISSAGVMALTILVSYEVFTRYVLGRPTIWIGEVCSYSLIWIGLLAVIVSLADERHLRVDLVFIHLHPKVQTILHIFTSVLMLAFSAAMLWKGSIYFWEAYTKGWEHYGILYISMSYTRVAVPVVGLILCVQIIIKIVDYVRSYGGEIT